MTAATPVAQLARPSSTDRWRPRGASDWLFLLIPSSAAIGSAFGSVDVAGVTLYPFKVLVLVAAGVVVAQHRRTPAAGHPVLILSVGLAGWALLSMTWSPAGPRALQEASIFIFVVALMVVAVRSIGTNWFASLITGWPLAIAVMLVVAAWELVTGNHLPSDFVQDAPDYSRGVVLATFGNPNNFGAFLALAAGICLIAATMSSIFDAAVRRLMVIAATLALVVLPITASRLAVLGMIAGLMTFGVLGLRSRRGQRFAIACAALAVPAVVVVWRVSPALVSKFVDIAAQSTGRGNSTSIRENLILNGWQFFVETGGMGVGAAGFESRIESGAFDHPLFGRATNPHNLWVELLSQYGLVGITTVVLILFLAVRAAAPLRRPSRFGVAYATALVVYVLAAMTASSYVNEPVSWTFFATFVAIGVWADAARRAAS